MKNIWRFIIMIILTILLLAVSVYLMQNDLSTYAIVFLTLTVIFFIISIASIPKNKSLDAIYNDELKKILKRYDAILAEIGNIPNLEDKNIMLITNIEDMVDAAVEIRKPVYYKKEDNYCIFSLLDNQDMCIHVLKQEKEKITPIEEFINNRKQSIERNIASSKVNKENSIKTRSNNKSFTKGEIEDNELENKIDNNFYNELLEDIDKKIDDIPVIDDRDLI